MAKLISIRKFITNKIDFVMAGNSSCIFDESFEPNTRSMLATITAIRKMTVHSVARSLFINLGWRVSGLNMLSRLSIIPIKLLEADHRMNIIENEMYPELPLYISFTQLIRVSPTTPGTILRIELIIIVSVNGVYFTMVESNIIIGNMEMNKKKADWAEYAGRLSFENRDIIRHIFVFVHHVIIFSALFGIMYHPYMINVTIIS